MNSEAESKTTAASGSKVKNILKELYQFLLIVGVVVVSRVLLVEPYYVPSGSMEPTLDIGDDLVTSKFPYGYSRFSMLFGWGPQMEKRLFEQMPARGDVVVFRLPRDTAINYVKRVIGLPGDRIQMISGRLWINDEQVPLKEDGIGMVEGSNGELAEAARFVESLPGGKEHLIFKRTIYGGKNDTGVYEVPPGHLFMMGDNRDNSLDSRFAAEEGGVGFVPMENLVGRADFILASWDFPITKQPIYTWFQGIRFSRIFARIH